MAQYGGHSQYGGTSQFGGQATRAETIYAILKAMALPGYWNLDDSTVSNLILAALCKGLEVGQLHADRVADEVLPHLARECLSDWESLLGVVPAANASITERSEAVISAWRGASPPTLQAIMEALAPVLNPEHEWVDSFSDEVINVEYTQHAGNGTIVERPDSLLRLDVPAASCGWPSGAPYVLRRVIDPTDEISVLVFMDDTTLSTVNNHMGLLITAGRDPSNLVGQRTLFFGVGYDAGDVIRADYYGDSGMVTNIAGAATPAEPSADYWIKATRADGVWSFYYGIDPDDLTLLGTWADQLVSPRHAGLYARNAGGADTCRFDVEQFKMSYGTQANNVHIHELNHDEATGGGAAGDPGEDWVFFSSVTRWPDDAGTYDLKNAQRIADRMAQGHTLILVGERNDFRCDDLESLCDRDVMSS